MLSLIAFQQKGYGRGQHLPPSNRHEGVCFVAFQQWFTHSLPLPLECRCPSLVLGLKSSHDFSALQTALVVGEQVKPFLFNNRIWGNWGTEGVKDFADSGKCTASWLPSLLFTRAHLCGHSVLPDFLFYLGNAQLQNGLRGTVLISVLPTKGLLRWGSLGHLWNPTLEFLGAVRAALLWALAGSPIESTNGR